MSKCIVLLAVLGATIVVTATAVPAGATVTFNGRASTTVSLLSRTSYTLTSNGMTLTCTTYRSTWIPTPGDANTILATNSRYTTSPFTNTSCTYVVAGITNVSNATIAPRPDKRVSFISRTSGEIQYPDGAIVITLTGTVTDTIVVNRSTVSFTWSQDGDGRGGVLTLDTPNTLNVTSRLLGRTTATESVSYRDENLTVS